MFNLKVNINFNYIFNSLLFTTIITTIITILTITITIIKPTTIIINKIMSQSPLESYMITKSINNNKSS